MISDSLEALMSISGIRHNLHKIEGMYYIELVCICDQKCYHVSVTLNFELSTRLSHVTIGT